MPITYSNEARQNLLSTSANEPFLVAIEIKHADLAIPARFVNDSQNIEIEGNEFFATAFRVALPDDKDQQLPQARLEVDNVGRELTQWLEYSRGGKGARCRLIQVLRSEPDVVEFDMTMDLTGLVIDNMSVSGLLGFKNTLGQTAVAVRFDPQSAPGLW
ncbi:DUF1833 family protein [Achromobacter xylosoxidans]|uniref:DUF1833 domain-containing protein n=1 Tax=Alcaligenes xylosoxydans xylosoxydans TaxID=85698 RepID=A0A1R1JUH1_ALCXX|nr:DUF1833 family protein [Achromobacter xylosoxidans]OMG88012.1 hypothetical protein BIZ92_10470 [Achromobacter xylosoxidans]